MTGRLALGYDVLVQYTESAINRGLAFARQPGMSADDIDGGAVVYDLAPVPMTVQNLMGLGYDQAEATALAAQNLPPMEITRGYRSVFEFERLQIRVPGAGKEVEVTSVLGPASRLQPLPDDVRGASENIRTRWRQRNSRLAVEYPLTGTVTFECPVVTRSRQGLPNVTVAGWAALLDMADAHDVQMQLNVPSAVVQETGRSAQQIRDMTFDQATADEFLKVIGIVLLTTPIPPQPGQPVADVAALDVAVTVDNGLGLLGLGLTTVAGCTHAPSLNGQSALPGLGNLGGAYAIGNGLLLKLVVRVIEASFGITFEIAPDCLSAAWSGRQAVTAEGKELFLTDLRLIVDPTIGGIRVEGNAAMKGFCWYAYPAFDFQIRFLCDPATGLLNPVATPINIRPNATIRWGCKLTAAALVGLIVPVVYGFLQELVVGIVAYLLLGLLEDSINSTMTVDGLSRYFGGLQLPLPISGVGLKLGTCLFDDFVAAGKPSYTDAARRVVPQRSHSAAAATSFDLDTGTVSTAVPFPRAADLVWGHPAGGGLRAVNGGRLEIVGVATLHDLTHSHLQTLAFNSSGIPGNLVPTTPAGALIVGVRTASGRYAKAQVWQGSGQLEILYETYERLAPALDVDVRWFVEKGQRKGTVIVSSTVITIERYGGTPTFWSDGPWSPITATTSLNDHRSRLAEYLPGLATMSSAPSSTTPTPMTGSRGPLDLLGHGLLAQRTFTMPSGVAKTEETTTMEVVINEEAHHGVFRATTQALDAPVRYVWQVDGVDVPPGDNMVGPIRVRHHPGSPLLFVDVPMGKGHKGTVCVTATDAAGRVLGRCETVDRGGETKPPRDRLEVRNEDTRFGEGPVMVGGGMRGDVDPLPIMRG